VLVEVIVKIYEFDCVFFAASALPLNVISAKTHNVVVFGFIISKDEVICLTAVTYILGLKLAVRAVVTRNYSSSIR
jgi:hypothetical protein